MKEWERFSERGVFNWTCTALLFQVVGTAGLLWIFRNSLAWRRVLEVWKIASEVKGVHPFERRDTSEPDGITEESLCWWAGEGL